jgi:hypothetical protein
MKQMAEIIGQLKGKLAAQEADHSIEQGKLNVDRYNAETNRLKAEVGPKGMAYDAAAIAPMVVQSVVHILQSPDFIEAAQSGASPQDLTAALLARMQGQPQEVGPEAAAGGMGAQLPPRPPAPPAAPPMGQPL